jgi:hypothetical protein
MKTQKIVAPEGYEIDREKSTIDEIVFKEKTFPKTWEELESVSGWFITPQGNVLNLKNLSTMAISHRDTFVTKEQAAASIALAQLSQLREVYRNGWEPDWRDDNLKCCINANNYRIYYSLNLCTFLSFQSNEIAAEFLLHFRDLIEQAKPLMS